MFIPILLSLGLMSGTNAATQVKNKLDTCPTNAELYALFKDSIDLPNLPDTFRPYKLDSYDDLYKIPKVPNFENILSPELKWISEMAVSYFSGDESIRRKTFDALNTINKDIISNANIIRNWVVELLTTGKRPPLYTVVPSLKALSTNEKTLTLDWFNSCIDDILSGKNNANDNLIDTIKDAVSEKQKLFSELVYRVTGKTAQNYEPCGEWGIIYPNDNQPMAEEDESKAI